MVGNKNCTVCNMKLDVVNYLKHRTVCKSCYNKNSCKNNSITSHHDQQSKVSIITTTTIEPQTADKNLDFLKGLEPRVPGSPRPRIPRSPRT